jgi:hypothetical protein
LFAHSDIKILKLASNVCIDKIYSSEKNGSEIAEIIEKDLATCNH